MEDKIKDDGSLAFLNIPREKDGYFNCPITNQQKLVNTSFWIVDIQEHIKTKQGEDRTLVLIKNNVTDTESDAKKFFTNSKTIKYILSQVKELHKFPRYVTLRGSGNRYFLE